MLFSHAVKHLRGGRLHSFSFTIQRQRQRPVQRVVCGQPRPTSPTWPRAFLRPVTLLYYNLPVHVVTTHTLTHVCTCTTPRNHCTHAHATLSHGPARKIWWWIRPPHTCSQVCWLKRSSWSQISKADILGVFQIALRPHFYSTWYPNSEKLSLDTGQITTRIFPRWPRRWVRSCWPTFPALHVILWNSGSIDRHSGGAAVYTTESRQKRIMAHKVDACLN